MNVSAGLFVALIASTPVAAPYTFRTITGPNAAATWLNGINDVGQIVGTTPTYEPSVETLSTGVITQY